MADEVAISLKNISKCFKRYDKPIDKLKEVLFSKGNYFNDFWALQDVNLEIPRGKAVGIVGVNGSGKSTLLQIIAGTLTPTTGEVKVKGRVSALLELGSGFNPEFTGRQNVFFNARLLGLNQSETENRFDEIAKFADIGDFIDQPVKTYSSGMFVRLAFAVAVNVNPDILIVDEALSVGDIFFQHRCIRQIRKLIDLGVTTLFVSHDSSTIKTLCDSAIIMNSGKILNTGLPSLIIKEYSKLAIDLELGFPPTDQSLQLGEISLSSLTNEDQIDLRGLIQRHLEETHSAVASAILSNFPSEVSNFTKILPRDYARVREIQAKAAELGHEPDGQEVWTQILEVING